MYTHYVRYRSQCSGIGTVPSAKRGCLHGVCMFAHRPDQAFHIARVRHLSLCHTHPLSCSLALMIAILSPPDSLLMNFRWWWWWSLMLFKVFCTYKDNKEKWWQFFHEFLLCCVLHLSQWDDGGVRECGREHISKKSNFHHPLNCNIVVRHNIHNWGKNKVERIDFLINFNNAHSNDGGLRVLVVWRRKRASASIVIMMSSRLLFNKAQDNIAVYSRRPSSSFVSSYTELLQREFNDIVVVDSRKPILSLNSHLLSIFFSRVI